MHFDSECIWKKPSFFLHLRIFLYSSKVVWNIACMKQRCNFCNTDEMQLKNDSVGNLTCQIKTIWCGGVEVLANLHPLYSQMKWAYQFYTYRADKVSGSVCLWYIVNKSHVTGGFRFKCNWKKSSFCLHCWIFLYSSEVVSNVSCAKPRCNFCKTLMKCNHKWLCW